jgi:hypothetical protein
VWHYDNNFYGTQPRLDNFSGETISYRVFGNVEEPGRRVPRANQQSFKPLDYPSGFPKTKNQKAAATSAAAFRVNRIKPDARANCPPRRRRTTGSPNAPMTVQGLVREWPNSVPAREPASAPERASARPQVWVLPA